MTPTPVPNLSTLVYGLCVCAMHCRNHCEPACCGRDAGWCLCGCHAKQYAEMVRENKLPGTTPGIKPIIVSLLCTALLGCATIHRHPTATKYVIMGAGAATGLTVGLLTRQQKCPSLGGLYNGTPGVNGCPTSCDKDGCYTGPRR